LKLYFAPGVCSIGIHVLLEEIGKPYELEATNLREGAQYKPEYMSVNPKSKASALLRDDGSLLTEYPAIAYRLARTNPFSNMLPDDIDLQASAREIVDYCVATVQIQGFTRMFRPANFSLDSAPEEAVKARGAEIAIKGFESLSAALEGKDYAVGKFSIADSALFYVEFWAGRVGVPLPKNCAVHLERMKARPSVQRTMKQEGI
jgi:glutathione S-transferase